MTRILSVCLVAVTLSACSLPQLAATATRAKVSPETVTRIASLCDKGAPLIRMAEAQPLSTAVGEIAEFVGSYCKEMRAGVVPATTDGGTESWLARNIAALRERLATRG